MAASAAAARAVRGLHVLWATVLKGRVLDGFGVKQDRIVAGFGIQFAVADVR